MSIFNKTYKQIVNEMTSESFKRVTSQYIYFTDDQELYQVSPTSPYKMIGGAEALATVKTNWERVKLATGEDVANFATGVDVDDYGAWFIVSDSFPGDQSFDALISV